MISKTLDEWKKETEKNAGAFYELYVSALNDPRCSEAMRNNYCNASKNNWELKETLGHIQKYGSCVSVKKCEACRLDPKHREKLQATYNKYQEWINSAIRNGSSAYTPRSLEVHRQILDAAIVHLSSPIPGSERSWDAKNNCWRVRSQVVKTEIVNENDIYYVNNVAHKKPSKKKITPLNI